jgi:hypothetical protein
MWCTIGFEFHDNMTIVAWCHGYQTMAAQPRQVRDKNMFMPYGFFFLDWVKLFTCNYNQKKKKCKEVFISDHKSNEFFK